MPCGKPARKQRGLSCRMWPCSRRQRNPLEVLDKVDVDQMVDELATGLGVPGKVIRADPDVAQIRQQRAEAQAAQMQQQQQMLEAQAAVQNAQGMANAAKTVNDIL